MYFEVQTPVEKGISVALQENTVAFCYLLYYLAIWRELFGILEGVGWGDGDVLLLLSKLYL